MDVPVDVAKSGKDNCFSEPSDSTCEYFEQLVLIRDQTLNDTIIKPKVKARVGVIEPFEATDETSESEPASCPIDVDVNRSDSSKHAEKTLDPEEKLISILDSLNNPDEETVMIKFFPQPGDVIIAAKPTRPCLNPDVDDNSTQITKMEANPLSFYPCNDPLELNGLVALYQDPFYFIDDGDYRKEVSEVYQFQQGDITARLGSFDQNWQWSQASYFNFYLYYPQQVEGECCQNLTQVGPWYPLNRAKTVDPKLDSPPKPDLQMARGDNPLPFSMLPYSLEFKDGDILLHHTNDRSLFPPWNVGLNITVETSLNRGELQSALQPLDKVLRYAVNVSGESTTIYVELFQFCGESQWKFLGKNEGLYNHITTRPALIRFNANCPQPGDILINRKGICRQWTEAAQTGGHVQIYRDASFFDVLKEPGEKLKAKDYRWGIGDDTTVIRFGTFANETWNWMPKRNVDAFTLTAMGTSLRRCCRIPWEDLWKPKANYYFPTCCSQNQEPLDLQPNPGDLIIRYSTGRWQSSDPECDDDVILDQNQDGRERVRIEIFNALHLLGNKLADGDFLLRVGHELSDKMEQCTHITAELYRFSINPNKNENDRHGFVLGRDAYVFGALPWPEKHDLFSGKHFIIDDDDHDDDDRTRRRDKVLDSTSKSTHSRALRLFLRSLGFPDLESPKDEGICGLL